MVFPLHTATSAVALAVLDCIGVVGMMALVVVAEHIHYALISTVPVGIESRMTGLVVGLLQGKQESGQDTVLVADKAELHMDYWAAHVDTALAVGQTDPDTGTAT